MKSAAQRIPYLDWVRGFAAIVMLQGHVFQSFLRADLRESGPYVMSQFVGGMPPAVFLFLLGLTFAFLMDSQEKKGVLPGARWLAAVRRSGYLFAAAFAVRLQLWSFSFGKSPTHELLRVDVLNCMGLALLILSVMAVFRTEERIRLCAVLGVSIAAASPLITALDWSSTPDLLRRYIVPDHASFGFFPWAAFVAFGMSLGSIIRLLKPHEVPGAMQWVGWGGLTLAFSAYAASNWGISLYSKSDFWLDNPTLIFIKVGLILILIAFAWLWNLRSSPREWSWVRQFGLTSLLVYWVHIELVYGNALGVLKERLTVPQTVFATIVMVLLMLGLSLARTNWEQVRGWLASSNRVVAESQEQSVSGD